MLVKNNYLVSIQTLLPHSTNVQIILWPCITVFKWNMGPSLSRNTGYSSRFRPLPLFWVPLGLCFLVGDLFHFCVRDGGEEGVYADIFKAKTTLINRFWNCSFAIFISILLPSPQWWPLVNSFPQLLRLFGRHIRCPRLVATCIVEQGGIEVRPRADRRRQKVCRYLWMPRKWLLFLLKGCHSPT